MRLTTTRRIDHNAELANAMLSYIDERTKQVQRLLKDMRKKVCVCAVFVWVRVCVWLGAPRTPHPAPGNLPDHDYDPCSMSHHRYHGRLHMLVLCLRQKH